MAQELRMLYEVLEYCPLPFLQVQNFLEPPFYHVEFIDELKSMTDSGNRFAALLDVLIAVRGSDATVPHDKAYSILGLVDPDQCDITVDYDSSLADLCTTVTYSIIERTQSLDCLRFAQNGSRQLGLPSWIPNLATKWKWRPLPDSLAHRQVFSKDPKGLNFTTRGNQTLLRIEGYQIDTIERICNDVPLNSDDDHQLARLFEIWKRFIETDVPGELYSSRHISSLGWQKLTGNAKALKTGSQRPWEHSVWFDSVKESTGAWLGFLSIGNISAHNLCYAKNGQLIPKEVSIFDSLIYNLVPLLLPSSHKHQPDPYYQLYSSLREYGIGRRLCMTLEYYVALVPEETMAGDTLCVLHGSSSYCLVLRAEGNYHILIGEACKFYPLAMSYLLT
jgi:hypothetical protein